MVNRTAVEAERNQTLTHLFQMATHLAQSPDDLPLAVLCNVWPRLTENNKVNSWNMSLPVIKSEILTDGRRFTTAMPKSAVKPDSTRSSFCGIHPIREKSLFSRASMIRSKLTPTLTQPIWSAK